MKNTNNNKKQFLLNIEQSGYTLISNNITRNRTLSASAKEIYIYLKSHKEGYNITHESLATFFNLTTRAIRFRLQELKENGFLKIEKTKERNKYIYRLFDNPIIEINDFTNENILDAILNGYFDLNGLFYLLKSKKITPKQFKEINNEIAEITKIKYND